MQKRILLPLKENDVVVRCPKNTKVHLRGQVGKVLEVIDNLNLIIDWEKDRSTSTTTHAWMRPANVRIPVAAYEVSLERDCHQCVHRVTHLSGSYCPMSHKEIKSVHETTEHKDAT